MIVQCSFCSQRFDEEEIIKKEVDPKIVEISGDFDRCKLETVDGKVIGEFCPHCGLLHIIGFKISYQKYEGVK